MKTTVTIKYPDFSKWNKAINDLTVEVGTAVQNTAIENAPYKSGVYRNGIEYDKAYTVTANANYSAAIEYGTKAHPITAKNAKTLHYIGNDGKDKFPKSVNHPGTQPNPVMRNSARAVQKQIPELFKEVQRKNGL